MSELVVKWETRRWKYEACANGRAAYSGFAMNFSGDEGHEELTAERLTADNLRRGVNSGGDRRRQNPRAIRAELEQNTDDDHHLRIDISGHIGEFRRHFAYFRSPPLAEAPGVQAASNRSNSAAATKVRRPSLVSRSSPLRARR
jgi:hypothetical protein